MIHEIYCAVVKRYEKMTAMMREMDNNRGKEETYLQKLSNMASVQAKKEEEAMTLLVGI